MDIISSKIDGNFVTLELIDARAESEAQISIKVNCSLVDPQLPLAWIQLEALKTAQSKLGAIIADLTRDLNEI